ncbi:putative chaperone DnaJ [Lupinus albus]|uniref:Putative chaperone DnaJ n=1 Tax=Lupinus albus TaxID=3870 RepID=A0A6A4Q4V3_LUPAL|nr:putative chaperone DnaJ [Lupinus albus]
MVDLNRVFGTNPIRSICIACKTIIRRWFRRRKSLSSKEDHKRKRHSQTQQEPVEDKKAGETMNGVHSFRFNDDPLRGNNPTSSRREGVYRHRKLDSSCFPCMMDHMSRNEYRKNQTPPNKSRVSYDSIPSPSSSSWNNSGNLKHPNLQSKTSSRRSNPIMYSNSSGMLKPPPIEKKIECTLEELCYGCQKKIKITRDVLTNTGGVTQEEELLTINVQPGWKKGTKITFEGKGNERPGAYREDIIFFISEKRHQLFRREKDDLELGIEIPLVKALTGCTISVPLLGGDKMNLTVDEIIYPGYEKIITGQGMPIPKESGLRGNLKITFLVEFPTQLTRNQRSEVFSILQDSC